VTNEEGHLDDSYDSACRWSIVQRIMQAKRDKNRSRHSAYAATLPNKLNALPLFWKEDKLEAVTSTSLGIEAAIEKRLLLRFFSDVWGKDYSPHDLDLFLWAMGIFKSRAKVTGDHIGMVPLLDLCNHQDLYASPWGTQGCVIVLDNDASTSELAYHLVALADVPSGEELVVDYSLLSFQSKVTEYGIIDRESNVLERYYNLALQNFKDKSNPIVLSVWHRSLSLALFGRIEEGSDQKSIYAALESRAAELEQLCSSTCTRTSQHPDCKFIRETDLFYVRHCLQNLDSILDPVRATADLQSEAEAEAKKVNFMSGFYNKTGLRIEM
jgi:hypothetical protein